MTDHNVSPIVEYNTMREENTKRVTIRDVAKLSGVSYQTVSRVLNDSPDVSDKTRKRVLRVIDE